MSEINQLVDRLGSVRESIKALKKQEEDLLSKLQDLEIGQVVFGKTYQLSVGSVVHTELDPKLVREHLQDDDKFMSIVSVTKKDASKVLLAPDIERLSRIIGTSKRFTVSKK